MGNSLKIFLLQKVKQVTMIKTKESITAMKRYFFLILAVLMTATVLLTACQPQGSEEQAPTIASYEGYSNIPDLGDIAGAKSDEALASAAAARMDVAPETVFVYPLGDIPEDALNVWTKELKARGYEQSGTLEEAGNTVTWYSDDRKIGVVAGYMDTDKQGGMDAIGVFLVEKSLAGKYVNIDYEEVQEGWGNANNGARFFIDDKKIFGFGYVGAAEGLLSKNTDSSSALMLVEGAHPRYVHEWNKTVYACLSDRLIAIDTKEKDPEEAVTTLLDGNLQSLQIVNEKLWYTTKNGLFYCDLDGENTVKVTGKKMKDAYVVGDKVYYRDAEDENTEHAYSLLTEVDTRVTEEAVSSFFLGSKGNGYYIAERDVKPEEPEEDEESAKEETTAKAEDEKSSEETSEETTAADGEEAAEEEPETAWTLIRVSLKDGKTTELTTVREGTALVGIGGKVYYVSDEHQGQIYSISKSGGTPKRVTRDEDCKYLMTFHDMILYYDYDDETEEGLEHIYISTPDGFMKSDILG